MWYLYCSFFKKENQTAGNESNPLEKSYIDAVTSITDPVISSET